MRNKPKRIRLCSPEMHERDEQQARNPSLAWTEGWGFEAGGFVKWALILITGMFVAWLIAPEMIEAQAGELLKAIAILFVWSVLLLLWRRNFVYKTYRQRNEPGEYMDYRKWRKTQPWHDEVERINKEIFKVKPDN